MKNRILTSILLFASCQSVHAGNFFNVSATGPSAQVSVTLCLNGQGPLSCQSYTVSALNLSIATIIPNHTYPNAGIKINTPGFSLAGCTLNANGYCLFSVSDASAADITLTQICQPGLVVFTPAVTRVNNPTGGPSNPSQQFTINMKMCNSMGQPLIPSANNPIHLDVYGAPNGVISPTSTTSNTGSVTFTYSGQSFPNNISINAWISDSSNNGAAIGVTEVLQQNAICTANGTSYDVPLAPGSGLPGALDIKADVGYDISSPTTTLKDYTIDTGSLGVIVPTKELPSNANVIGPAAPGVKYYDSSGNTYSGNYYLAPVRIQTSSGSVQTQPIMVLAIDKAYCSGPKTKKCNKNPPSPNLHYLGVGFNRNSSTGNDLFNSPTANAFLHITNASNGTDMTPGYYLTPSDGSAATAVQLGITSTNQYNIVNLAPNPAVPGDFLPQAGCYSFPNIPGTNKFCGTALLDVGIDYMFIDLPKAQWPAGTYNANDDVPAGHFMHILMGDTNTPAMEYSFTTILSTALDNPATPAKVEWVDTTKTGQVFFNTGRRPLYIYNYLYNGQCGQVGFKPLP